MACRCDACQKFYKINIGSSPNSKELTFHRFPKESYRREMWFELLGFDEDKVLSQSAKICSKHFEDTDFVYRHDGAKYLKKNALPKRLNIDVSEGSDFCPDSPDSTLTEVSMISSDLSLDSPLIDTSSTDPLDVQSLPIANSKPVGNTVIVMDGQVYSLKVNDVYLPYNEALPGQISVDTKWMSSDFSIDTTIGEDVIFIPLLVEEEPETHLKVEKQYWRNPRSIPKSTSSTDNVSDCPAPPIKRVRFNLPQGKNASESRILGA